MISDEELYSKAIDNQKTLYHNFYLLKKKGIVPSIYWTKNLCF